MAVLKKRSQRTQALMTVAVQCLFQSSVNCCSACSKGKQLQPLLLFSLLTDGVWNAVAVGVDAQIESFLVRLNSLDDVVSDQQNFTLLSVYLYAHSGENCLVI